MIHLQEHQYAQLMRELSELRALAETLPVTADGVRVGILQMVWATTGNRYCVIDGWRCQFDPPGDGKEYPPRVGDGEFLRVACCYSTLEKALAARGVAGTPADGDPTALAGGRS